jgi:hypothetical protein
MYTHDKETEESDYLDDAAYDDNSNFIQSERTLKTSVGTGEWNYTGMGSTENTLTFFNNDTITNGGTITLPPLKTTLNIKD